MILSSTTIFFKILFIFRERGGKEKEREWNINVWLPLTPPTGDLTHNSGMCPDWVLNRRPFGFQAGAQSTELHKPEFWELVLIQ